MTLGARIVNKANKDTQRQNKEVGEEKGKGKGKSRQSAEQSEVGSTVRKKHVSSRTQMMMSYSLY